MRPSWEEIIRRLRNIGLSDWEIQVILERPYDYIDLVKEYTVRRAAAKSVDHFINNYKGVRKPKSLVSSIIERLQKYNGEVMKMLQRTFSHRTSTKVEEEKEEKRKEEREEEEVMIVRIKKELV